MYLIVTMELHLSRIIIKRNILVGITLKLIPHGYKIYGVIET